MIHLRDELIVHENPQVTVVFQLTVEAAFVSTHLLSKFNVPWQLIANELESEIKQ